MNAKFTNKLAIIYPFVVRVEATANGYRADLGFFKNSEADLNLGHYISEEGAFKAGLLEARKLLKKASECEALSFKDYIDGKLEIKNDKT